MSDFKYKLKNLKEETNLDNISNKLSKLEPFQVDLDLLMDKSILEETLLEIYSPPQDLEEMARAARSFTLTDNWEEIFDNKFAKDKKRDNLKQALKSFPDSFTPTEFGKKAGLKDPQTWNKFIKALESNGAITQVGGSTSSSKEKASKEKKEKAPKEKSSGDSSPKKQGAWWSYLAEYLTGLSLVKKLNKSGKILVKDGESSLKKIEDGLRQTLNKKINDSPDGKEWWASQADKRVKITKASRAMADKIISKLEKEKILDEYVLSMVVASGGGTGGQNEKADLKLSFTPIEDYKITPKDIGISIKTSLGNNKSLTVQPSLAKVSRFISLGDETGKGGKGNVSLQEFINSLKEAGLNKGPMVDLLKFLSLWKDIKSKSNQFALDYEKLTGLDLGKSAFKTSIQDTLTSLISNESYQVYNSRNFSNKISEKVYNELNSKYGDELRKEYSELLSSYPKDTLSHAVAKAFIDGVNTRFSSANSEEWDQWKKYFLRWLGFGNGEWIIKSWYGRNPNTPSVEDVLDLNTRSGKAIQKLIDDFLNKDTRLEILYKPEGDKATFQFQIVNPTTGEKYVAWDAHIIQGASTQWTMDLSKLIKSTKV